MDPTAVFTRESIRVNGKTRAREETKPGHRGGLAHDDVCRSAHPAKDSLPALHRAVLAGGTEPLRELLRDEVDVNVVEKDTGRTALHFAALDSNANAAKALVEAGAAKDARDADGLTPLHLACRVGFGSDPVVALYLLRSGASAVAADSQGVTPLHTAVRSGWAFVVKAMVSPQSHARSPRADPNGTTAVLKQERGGLSLLLHEAVIAGHAEVVTALVDGGWEEVASADRRRRPGMGAASPQPHPAAEDGAATGGRKQKLAGGLPAVTSLQVLSPVAAGGDQVNCSPLPPRRPAEERCALLTVPHEEGEELSLVGASPLMMAADSGRPDVVRALLRGKSRGFPDEADAQGFTALHLAAMRGSASIVKTLLEQGGANRDATNHAGDTALLVAVASEKIDAAEALLQRGASVNLANRRGHTALHFAAALGLAAFAKQLIDCGADVCAVDGEREFVAISEERARAVGASVAKAGNRLCSNDDAPRGQAIGRAGGRRGAFSNACRNLCSKPDDKKRSADSTSGCEEGDVKVKKTRSSTETVNEGYRDTSLEKRRKKTGNSSETVEVEQGNPSKKRRTSAVATSEPCSSVTSPQMTAMPRERPPTRSNNTTKAVVRANGRDMKRNGMLEVGVQLRGGGKRNVAGNKNKSTKGALCNSTSNDRVQSANRKQSLEGERKYTRPPPRDRSGCSDRKSSGGGGGGGPGVATAQLSGKQSSSRAAGGGKSGTGGGTGNKAKAEKAPKKRARGSGGKTDVGRVDATGGNDERSEATPDAVARADGVYEGGTDQGIGGHGGSMSVSKGQGLRREDDVERLGKTPLHYAASNGRLEAARVLLEAGAVVGHDGNEGKESPLFEAATGGHAEVVGLLLEQLGLEDVEACALSGRTPLSVAVERGHVDVVDKLIEKGANIHRPDLISHQSLLSTAVVASSCLQERVRLVQSLLKAGADPNGAAVPMGKAGTGHPYPPTSKEIDDDSSKQKGGRGLASPATAPCPTPSAPASTLCRKEGVGSSGERRGSPESSQKFTPLHNACRVIGGVEVVKVLLEAGADADGLAGCRGARGLQLSRLGERGVGSAVTPLHIAAAHGNAPIVHALTFKGCRLDAETLNPSRSTALALAVQGGHLAAARALVEAGASIAVVPRRENGEQLAPSLVHLAAGMKRGDLVSVLTDALVKRDSAESWTREWAHFMKSGEAAENGGEGARKDSGDDEARASAEGGVEAGTGGMEAGASGVEARVGDVEARVGDVEAGGKGDDEEVVASDSECRRRFGHPQTDT